MPQLINGWSVLGQILGGLMVLMPFVLRDRYKTGKWFFDKQSQVAGTSTQLQPALFALSFFVALGSIGTFFIGEVLFGWLLLSCAILFNAWLTVNAPGANS